MSLLLKAKQTVNTEYIYRAVQKIFSTNFKSVLKNKCHSTDMQFSEKAASRINMSKFNLL